VLCLVVGRTQHEGWEEASEPAACADDPGDGADPFGWCQLRDPRENSTRAEPEEECHQDERRTSGNLRWQPQRDDQRHDGSSTEGDGDDDTRTDLVGHDAANRSCDHGCDGEACRPGTSAGQVEGVDILQICRQVGRESHETTEGDGIEE
jgi:hypothetical protein